MSRCSARLRITGWPADQPRSVPVIDLATYLALHPERPYTAEELRDPLSIGKPRALEADTIRTYAGTLRRSVGADRLPDAGRRGYALSGALTDWRRFNDPLAAVAHGAEPAEQAASLPEALALVRGSPFCDLPANGFGWVATELLVSQVEVAVTGAAQRLVELALAAGDWPLADWAANRGLTVSPTAEGLNAGVLQAAQLSGQADRIAQVWRDISRRYTAAEEPVPTELGQLHDQTRHRSPSTPQH
ncbi:MAG: bacterial transcriptional activator domain-containing protein [Actinomycetota bacterium]|nr:bacterial transcriptional activator domain-containing protein [Actinomycetota bacterium]